MSYYSLLPLREQGFYYPTLTKIHAAKNDSSKLNEIADHQPHKAELINQNSR